MSVHARLDRRLSAHIRSPRPRLDGDAAFAFCAFATALFILVLPKIGPTIFLALLGLQAAYRPDRIARALPRVAPILVIPAYCLLSASWSAVPQTTLYYATLYLITATTGLMLGGVIGSRSFLTGLFLAFASYAAACFSIALSSGFFWSGGFGKSPLIVLAGSKNVSGDVAALGTMIGATMLLVGLRERRPGWALASIALIAIELILARAALSTGAIVSMLVGLAAIALLGLASIVPAPARATGLIGGVLLAGVAAATQRVWLQPILSTVLKAGGKDSTFTGRTYIWSRAEVLIAQRPTLGLGFNAFWRVGNLEAEAIWTRLFITNKFGFNFHNSRLDILVHLGYVGLALFIVIFAVYGAILAIRTLRDPDPAAMLLVAVLCYEATRMGFESVGYGIFHHATFLLFAALAFATRPARNAGGSRSAPAGWPPEGLRRSRSPLRSSRG